MMGIWEYTIKYLLKPIFKFNLIKIEYIVKSLNFAYTCGSKEVNLELI